MSTLSSKLQRIEENINSIRTVSGLEGRVLEEIPTEIETKFNELNTTVTEKEAELTTANETIATQAAEIETLNNRIAELEGSTEHSTYQIDIAFRDSETNELLSNDYATSVSLSNADGSLINTFTGNGSGIIIGDLTPGTYNLVFNEITSSRADIPAYNRPENITATIVDSNIVVDVNCIKVKIVGEPAEVIYTVTNDMIKDGAVVPEGVLFGLKSIPAEKAITLDMPYDMLMNGEKLIQLDDNSPLAIVQEYSDSKILGTEDFYDSFEIYYAPDKKWMNNAGAYIYGVVNDAGRSITVQDINPDIHGTGRVFEGDIVFRTTRQVTLTYSDIITQSPDGKLLGLYYVAESIVE